MAYSARYISLRSRVNQLRKQFLPRTFSPIGAYKPAQLDNARAFRVLSHAEFEHYFEERARDIAIAAYDIWKNQQKATSALIHILTSVKGKMEGLPTELGTNGTALTVAGKAVAQFRHAVTTNNGITSSDLLKLLLPLGVKESEIDTTWILTTDGFAKKRGTAAHSAAITYSIDPKDDYQTVMQILGGVRDIDVILNAIKSKIR